jgi:hypothetical protein
MMHGQKNIKLQIRKATVSTGFVISDNKIKYMTINTNITNSEKI